MNVQRTTFKITGLVISLLLPLLLAYLAATVWHIPSGSIAKELLMWLPFILLFLLVTYGEKTSFADLGFRQPVGKSLLLALVILISIVGVMSVYSWLYFLLLKQHPPKDDVTMQLRHTSIWIKLLIAIRAGVTEETFFRAYGITRLQEVTGRKWIALALPLILFAAGHYFSGGFAHVANAFVIGAVLTIFFVRRRNLVANILAHVLLDSILLLV